MTREEFICTQGDSIVAALQEQGYIVAPLQTGHGWQVTQPNEDWWLLLTFLPRPVAQWRFLPAASDDRQQQLYSIVEQTIGGRR